MKGRDGIGLSFERGEVGSTEDEFGEEGVDSGQREERSRIASAGERRDAREREGKPRDREGERNELLRVSDVGEATEGRIRSSASVSALEEEKERERVNVPRSSWNADEVDLSSCVEEVLRKRAMGEGKEVSIKRMMG